MAVTTDDIRAIKPGQLKPFICQNALGLNSAASLVTRLKRVGMPEGVIDYETQKFYDKNLILIRALRPEDTKILNR